MRATDLAYYYFERADRIFDLSGRDGFATRVLSLSPAQTAKLEVVAPDVALDGLAWSDGSFALCLVDAGESPVDEQLVHRVIEQAPEGMACMVLLPQVEWYVRSLLDPLTRAGWVVKTLVAIANQSFDCVLVAVRGYGKADVSLRVRNEYVLLQYMEGRYAARIDALEQELEKLEEQRQAEALEQEAARVGFRRQIEQLEASMDKALWHSDVVTARLATALKQLEEGTARLERERRQNAVVTQRWKKAQATVDMVRRSGRFRFGDAFFQLYKRPRDLVAGVWSARPGAPAPAPPPPPPAPGTVPVAPSAPRPVITLVRPKSPPALSQLRVGAILDEMSEQCFAPECELIRFTPNNWQQELQSRPPHFLLVESAWQGNGGSWQYKIGRYNHPDAGGLSELLGWCNANGIPTVFWNKEDPVHFDKFKHAAAQFDVVFTTDAGAAERYEALPSSRITKVGALPFAAQPRLHNPVYAGARAVEPCFAGSYYGNRHPDRRAQQEMLLDAAREHGVVIYDRNFGSEAAEFQFPERFRPHIRGRLPYAELSRVYKQHRIFLNVNSVIDSPTMMSRRVYELLASGTAVVSTPSLAIQEVFGDRVFTVTSAEETAAALQTLISDRAAWTACSREGVRYVMAQHTYADRLRTIADALELCPGISGKPAVTVAAVASDAKSVAPLRDWILGQTGAPVAELLVGCQEASAVAPLRELVERVAGDMGAEVRGRVVKLDSTGLAAYRELAALATQDWVFVASVANGANGANGALPADDEHLLGDLAQATQFSQAPIIGRAGASVGDEPTEQAFVDTLETGALLVARSLLERAGWPSGDGDTDVDADTIAKHITALRREGAQLHSVRGGG